MKTKSDRLPAIAANGSFELSVLNRGEPQPPEAMPNLFRSFYPVSVRMSVRDLYSMITNLIDYRGPLQKSRHGVFSPNKTTSESRERLRPSACDRPNSRAILGDPISPLGCLLDWTKFVDENHSQKSSGSIVSRSFFTASALS
jgi:hypothetical protein